VGVIVHDKALIYDPDFNDKSQKDKRLSNLRPVERKEAYEADITYGTNNEFGFDYLRDNMVQALDQKAQRGHHYAIVDEVDSILIDEARTPLIISAPDAEPTSKYNKFASEVSTLSSDTDFTVDEKLRTANLTDHGIKKIEKRLKVDNLYEKDFDTLHHLEQALKAKTLFHKDKQYVIKDNQVIIVDEHTGRLMHGRRYSDGLHQAIEAKEGVVIQQESRTLATISLQNYFRMYQKLAGMTGTAATEAEEFKKIYNLEVMVIPTNKPVVRKDHADSVYKTVPAKYAAVVREVEQKYKKGQPVLIGTRSIDHNQIVSQFLKRKNIPHNVLNAKKHQSEAIIIAEAGKKHAVTVATNMAGRGVDIVLGGAQPDESAGKRALNKWQKDHQEILKLGGLHVLGTERHESRRIDNQLRGRSGRQGDPGSSRFYVALEDDIMRLFGGEKISNLMTTLKMPEDQPLESGIVSRAIEQAQTKVEGFYFDQRKRVVEYDDVMNKQREIIYKKRNKILEDAEDKDQDDLKDLTLEKLKTECEVIVNARAGEGFTNPEYDSIVKEFITLIPFDDNSQAKLRTRLKSINDLSKIITTLEKITDKTYLEREKLVGNEVMRQIEKMAWLSVIDSQWMDHLDAVEGLREGIGLRGYAQKDPLVEYKAEAFDMFEALIKRIDYEVCRRIFRIQVQRQQAPQGVPHGTPQKDETDLLDQAAKQGTVEPEKAKPKIKLSAKQKKATGAFAQALASRQPTPQQKMAQAATQQDKGKYASRRVRIGRNDPCWCGSSKKWKKCHFPDKGK